MYVSVSITKHAGTVRGLHFQRDPFSENKLLTVTSGSIFDLVVDLDDSKPLEKRIHTFRLSSHDGQTLFIPRGFAHGFQALSEDTTVIYCLDSKYVEEASCGYSPLSPSLIELWPLTPSNIKSEDLAWPVLD